MNDVQPRTVPPSDTNITLATLVELVAQNVEVKSNPTSVASTRGRVTKDAETGDIFVGTGDSFLDVQQDVGIEVPRFVPGTSLPDEPSLGSIVFDTDRGLPAWWDRDHYEWPNFVDDVLVSSQTVSNTVERTSVWNPVINPDSLIKGRVYQVDLHGTFGTANTSDQFTIDIDLGGTDVAGVTNAAANADPGTPWTLELSFTVRDHGETGVLKANTRATFDTQPRTASHAEFTVDTTTATNLEVFIDWDAANVENVVTLEQGHLKQMG